jgi:MYXO-CTERM domain-containing protein
VSRPTRLGIGHRNGPVTEVGFSTGSAPTTGYDGLPQAAMTSAVGSGDAVRAVVEVAPLVDPDALSWVAVAQGERLVFAGPTTDLRDIPVMLTGDRGEEVCVAVTQFDGAGVAHGPVEACREVRSCSVAPPAGWLVAALAGLLVRRRR